MTIEIKKEEAEWLVNGKQYKDLSFEEKDFFDQFIVYMKLSFESEKQEL